MTLCSIFFVFRPPCLHDAEAADLGYTDVVERCDSVDLGEVNFDELHKCSTTNQGNRSKPLKTTLDMAFSPGLQVRKSR